MMPAYYPRPPVLEATFHVTATRYRGVCWYGKTYTIEHVVLDLLVQRCAAREVLVLTFTERADGASTRIRSKIEEILFNRFRDRNCHLEQAGMSG